MPENPSNSRRSEHLREQIEERIATGDFAPGMRLDETELARIYGVSRTPIREALIQLASVGIVLMRPRRGAVVPEAEPRRLFEMFEVMGELEAMCAALAARRITQPELRGLTEAHRACEDARDRDDADAYYRKNEVFHFAIYAASHNSFLAEQSAALHRRLRPYRRLQLRVRDRVRTSFAEHQAIVDAIAAGDSELAARNVRAHIVVQGDRFADLIASLSRMNAAASLLPLPVQMAPAAALPTNDAAFASAPQHSADGKSTPRKARKSSS